MQVKCTDCGWTGDSNEAEGTGKSENEHGITTEEYVCPECSGELVEA